MNPTEIKSDIRNLETMIPAGIPTTHIPPTPASQPRILGATQDFLEDLLDDRSFYTGETAAQILAAIEFEGTWRPRNKETEEDATFRQAIPYVVVTNVKTGQYLLMTRMTGQTEKRLHGKDYIGVGGHIEVEDTAEQFPENGIVQTAARREIAEETGFKRGVLTFAGIVCVTDENAPLVNRVHLGVVYHLHTPDYHIKSDEAGDHAHRWVTGSSLVIAYPNMELWAQIVCHDYLKIVS
jgi:predicted NUDIX family phosphoesterase